MSYIRGCGFIKILFLLFFWVLLMLTVLQLHPLEDVTKIFNLEPHVNKSPSLSEDEILLKEVQNRMPSLPIVYWNKYKNKPMYINSTCAKFPSIFDLEFNNIYWQTLKTTNGTFQLYGAYYDTRKQNELGAAIRILGMIDRIEPIVSTHCQVWYDGKNNPLIVKTLEYEYIWYKEWGNYKQGIYQPYLIACPIPESYRNLIPSSVSLVEKPCDNTINNLRVIYDQPEEKKDFAVCVKGLDFLHQDVSVRLVEWIELLGLLGADKVYFYELQVHPNVSKVLKHYETTGQAQVTPISLAGGQPNVPVFQHLYLTTKVTHQYQNELIPYNDCFYKHMYQYKYIALLDIDEVIMPTNSQNWKELMASVLPKALEIQNEEHASYNVRHVYFLDDFRHSHGWIQDIPKYMHMLQHVYRAKRFTKPENYVKCFYNTETVLTLHNHFPLNCLSRSCTSYPIETSDARLQHYRFDCVQELKKYCEMFKRNSVMDTTIWKYKDPLVDRVTRTLKTLSFLSENGGK